MKVLHFDISNPLVLNEPIVACIGYFDGLHKGHQALINRTLDYANTHNLKSCLITFDPDPSDVIETCKHKHLQSFKTRLRMIEEYNLDYCIILKFTEDMAKLRYELFFDCVLAYLKIRYLICGFDFKYGYKGMGNFHTLKAYSNDNFDVEMVDSINYNGDKISTSLIKKALSNGDIELINTMLGYEYFIEGIVTKGKHIGHLINFPTANLEIDDEVYPLKEGVYIAKVLYRNQYYKSMVNIGYNPTISINNHKTIEVHLLDFNYDIYGERLCVYFNTRLRDEMKFNSLEELSSQLSKDREMVREYYGK